jgi:GTP-binding protein
MKARAEAASALHVVSASFVAGATDAAKLPAPALAEIAFAGRSNVGKSSLLNTLVERKSLVRTSSTPGCTRQINMFGVTLKSGHSLYLVDLPGYGYARVAKSERKSWGPMLEGYLRTRPTLRAVVVIVDVRRGVEEDDAQLLEFLRTARGREEPLTGILVATKLDKLPRSKQKPALDALRRAAGGGLGVLGFSSESGDGRELLWERILRAV